jgi:hypothetical protein
VGINEFINKDPLILSVTESSAETLNACGEAIRPVYQQARIVEAGRIAPIPTSDNSHL